MKDNQVHVFNWSIKKFIETCFNWCLVIDYYIYHLLLCSVWQTLGKLDGREMCKKFENISQLVYVVK